MRVCTVSRRGRNIMSWFYNHLYPVLEWLWRRLTLIWRCLASRMIFPILGFGSRFLSLVGRSDRGNEPETNPKDRSPARGPHADDEMAAGEVQPEAAGGKRAAGFDRKVNNKRARFEEEEDEDESDSEELRVEPTDEFYCVYDSTWETEEDQEDTSWGTRRPAASKSYKFSRFESAARDMQNYRQDYPNQTRRPHWKKPAADDKPNLNFYLGLTPSLPDGVYISDFHQEWYGEYDTLEYVHTFIQWLFPLQEPGLNYDASILTKEEIKEFCNNSTAKDNLLKSYKLMLDFYGITLCDEATGKVMRAHNWRDRFDNLNSHTHNNLRITRILKCLGTLGYPHYQAPLVRFFLEETLINGELPNVKDSVLNYFMFAVLSKRERRDLIKFAYQNYDRKDEFVWCPKKIQMLWSKPQKKRNGRHARDFRSSGLRIKSETQNKAKEAARAKPATTL